MPPRKKKAKGKARKKKAGGGGAASRSLVDALPAALLVDAATFLPATDLARLQCVCRLFTGPAPGDGDGGAAAALFLASDECQYITGSALTIDGGTLAKAHF